MSQTIRNLDFIRNENPRLYEALQDIIQQHANTSQQGNLNPTGQPEPPPAISSLKVTASNGHFQVAINDPNPIYRGISYFVEHADNPQFTNAHIEELGSSRNANFFLGNVTRYWRAYSSYPSSAPGPPAYHGGSVPMAVVGGGSIPGPSFQASQGSGTGTPGQGLTGPGITPFRGSIPPIRKNANPAG